MQSSISVRTLVRRLSTPLRTLSQQAQAVRNTQTTQPLHRQSARWRPRPATNSYSTPPSVSTQTKINANQHSDSRNRLLLSYHDLERALERRGLKSGRALLVGVAATGLAVALAWPRIKQWGAAEGAEVAAASLEQQQLQERFSVMVHEVLADPRTGEQVEQLLKAAVLALFEDEYFNDKAVEWTAKVLSEALLWDSVRDRGAEYVQSVLADDESKESAYNYLSEAVSTIVADSQIQDAVATGIWSGVRATFIGRRKRKAEDDKSTAVSNSDGKQTNVMSKDQKDAAADNIPVQAASVANGDGKQHASGEQPRSTHNVPKTNGDT